MSETKIGTVTHYITYLHGTAVEIADCELHSGDRIHIKGHTADFIPSVGSMESEHESVHVAKPRHNVAIAMNEYAWEHDSVTVVH